MVFSSTVFIFCFLPLTLLVSLLLPRKGQNIWLLLASLTFYAWGGVSYSLILIGSLLLNYGFGLLLNKFPHSQKKVLALGVGINLLVLVIFKYADFFAENINTLAGTQLPLPHIKLPIGISFFTFQAISYLVDVYRKETKVQKSLIDLSLYISLFPQLIAGPIVRYHDIAQQLKNRVRNWQHFASGVERFVIGLGKKVLIANTLAVVADDIFETNPDIMTPTMALVGTLAYTFQIYFDFAGYSDMAIGLGRMFGFEFLENFNFPYISKSIQEFWRRWHISLSTWFRDYLYIPLGGNRVGNSRLYINLLIVFLCTGFWHGPSWNFVIWGLFHGFFLVAERIGLARVLKKVWLPIPQLYTFIIVVVGWVFFRAETLPAALAIIGKLGNVFTHFNWLEAASYLQTDVLLAFIASLLASLGWFQKLHDYLAANKNESRAMLGFVSAKYAFLLVVLFLSMSFLSANTYNPFIYFRF
ncbi:MBOAT family protein [bacterium]|nr:MBOAT family protein [bacterium]